MDLYIFFLILELFIMIMYKIFSKRQFKKFGNIKISLIIIITIYIVLNLLVIGNGKYLEYRLNTFDLNGDGIFSAAEQTLEQEEMFRRVIWDTGRNFFPIIFGILNIPFFLILLFSGKILDKIIKKYKDNKIRANCI